MSSLFIRTKRTALYTAKERIERVYGSRSAAVAKEVSFALCRVLWVGLLKVLQVNELCCRCAR